MLSALKPWLTRLGGALQSMRHVSRAASDQYPQGHDFTVAKVLRCQHDILLGRPLKAGNRNCRIRKPPPGRRPRSCCRVLDGPVSRSLAGARRPSYSALFACLPAVGTLNRGEPTAPVPPRTPDTPYGARDNILSSQNIQQQQLVSLTLC